MTDDRNPDADALVDAIDHVIAVTCAGNTDRACRACGEPLTGRSDQAYCSGACRVRAHREAEAKNAPPIARPRWCEWCDAELPPSAHPLRKFCNNACKQAWYRECGGPPMTPAELAKLGEALSRYLPGNTPS